MICHLPNNVLLKYALNWFSSENPYKYSWFQQIVDISVLYKLPSPQTLLLSPLKKDEFKLMVKKLVVSYWEETLRREASEMKSLTNFKPAYMSIENLTLFGKQRVILLTKLPWPLFRRKYYRDVTVLVF